MNSTDSKQSDVKLSVCVIFTGTLGLLGNLWVIIVILSSQSMRRKSVNVLFTSQSLLDFLCGSLLILSRRVKIFVPEAGHYGIKGNSHFSSLCFLSHSHDK